MERATGGTCKQKEYEGWRESVKLVATLTLLGSQNMANLAHPAEFEHRIIPPNALHSKVRTKDGLRLRAVGCGL